MLSSELCQNYSEVLLNRLNQCSSTQGWDGINQMITAVRRTLVHDQTGNMFTNFIWMRDVRFTKNPKNNDTARKQCRKLNNSGSFLEPSSPCRENTVNLLCKCWKMKNRIIITVISINTDSTDVIIGNRRSDELCKQYCFVIFPSQNTALSVPRSSWSRINFVYQLTCIPKTRRIDTIKDRSLCLQFKNATGPLMSAFCSWFDRGFIAVIELLWKENLI